MTSDKATKPKFIALRSQSPRARILLRTPIHTEAYSLNLITIQSNYKQIEQWRNASGITEQFLVIVLLPERPATEDGLDPVATLGDTGLTPLNVAAGAAECGIVLNSGPNIRRKGIAVEALAMQFAYGKDNVPMRGHLEKKFGLAARWREEKGDWELVVTKSWWKERQDAAGADRMVVSVDEGL
ncbi:hypothetical protein NLJ89_g12194 [Agrocybe chaxingu]|uniref:N-acetyltransferase domain-containing protein n=1 Tax=Agrocybe chaxingu TaxID=84603 RepID=A0A9W8JNK3_9AGAR|nr:hypothetical protein NLJ89_g12194 [Agrocybe chaxingu]